LALGWVPCDFDPVRHEMRHARQQAPTTTCSKAEAAKLGDATRTRLLEKHPYKVVDVWLVIVIKKIRFNTAPATRI
jgi:hypothetical protein